MFGQHSTPSSGRPVCVYIDDSNIAIGGKRLYHPGATRVRRPWNYDISFLFHIVMREFNFNAIQELPRSCLHFYGADLHRSPQLYYLHAFGVVHGYDCPRNRQGQEKQADVGLAVDMTERAKHAWDFGNPCEFVLVSGDGDFLPVVWKVLGYGFNVHIWS
ncbi:nyn domain-containing [Fusarium sporotrichioides]|uniref:Nyn domain-containing n=1 Tax=Fusarium sporotrichioides TaxID=5514 RepID=A0A395SD96_FUSSP|nr:nyn domain-containing [Fusarium sporotrichioides]